MFARRFLLSLVVMTMLFSGSAFADDPSHTKKVIDPQEHAAQQRRSTRSYSVAPSGGPMLMMRNRTLRLEGTPSHMLVRSDRKIPGLYFVR